MSACVFIKYGTGAVLQPNAHTLLHSRRLGPPSGACLMSSAEISQRGAVLFLNDHVEGMLLAGN